MSQPFGDDLPKPKPRPHEIGQDLSALSVYELEERIALLKAEITRLAQARDTKAHSRSAADSIFRKG